MLGPCICYMLISNGQAKGWNYRFIRVDGVVFLLTILSLLNLKSWATVYGRGVLLSLMYG